MSKIEILGNQIASDFDSLSKDVEAGLVDNSHIESELARINEKLKVWGAEARKIINKVEEGIDNIVEANQEQRAERDYEEHQREQEKNW